MYHQTHAHNTQCTRENSQFVSSIEPEKRFNGTSRVCGVNAWRVWILWYVDFCLYVCPFFNGRIFMRSRVYFYSLQCENAYVGCVMTTTMMHQLGLIVYSMCEMRAVTYVCWLRIDDVLIVVWCVCMLMMAPSTTIAEKRSAPAFLSHQARTRDQRPRPAQCTTKAQCKCVQVRRWLSCLYIERCLCDYARDVPSGEHTFSGDHCLVNARCVDSLSPAHTESPLTLRNA